MKTIYNFAFFCTISLIGIFNSNAQTSGTLSFSFNTTAHSGKYGPDHAIAIWIENSSSAFVITNARIAKDSHVIKSHLVTWKAKSALNVVDAVTGSTLTSYTAPVSVSWNGKDASGNIVPDGTYKIWIEESWDEGTTGYAASCFSFEKGAGQIELTPTSTANFTNLTLSWTPNTTAEVNSNKAEISIYPNPTKGMVNLKFSQSAYYNVVVRDMLGKEILKKEFIESGNINSLNISSFPNGFYILSISDKSNQKLLNYRILLKK